MEFGYAVPETLKPALDYKPRILGPKIEGFPFLVHKLSVILTALQYKPVNGMKYIKKPWLIYNGARMVYTVSVCILISNALKDRSIT